ncbi:hypothetical protein FD755_025234, partial [Muntiacus reevesi]
MGGSSSKPTVLDCMIKDFKKGFAGGYGVKMTPRKLRNLFPGTPEHPDQFPYIGSWLLIAQTLLPLARFCMNGQGQNRKKEGEKNLYSREDSLLPPPYTPMTPQAPAQPKLYPLPGSPPPSMFPSPPHEQDSSPEPLATARQMPLGETQGPQQVNEDGSPFSTTDLNWKHHNPAYSDKPQAMIDLLEPNWNFNTRGQETLGRYHDALLHGFRAGAKKPTNMSKMTTIIQKADGTPTNFYERLCEAFRTYTPFDPETPENHQMINAAFLQKLEGFAGMNVTQPLEVA